MKEKKLFKIFKEKDGLELYEAIKEFVVEEKRETAREQLDRRNHFVSLMSNLWNNSGWDDKKDWSRKLDVIREEGKKIYISKEIFNLVDEE